MIDKILDGRYEIIRKLGQGGFGATYLAIDRKVLLSQKRFPEALDFANQAIANSRNPSASIYIVRSRARMGTGDSKGAMSDLNQAIHLNPGFLKGAVYSLRSKFLSQQGDLKGALADLNKAMDFEPEKTDYLIKRATIRTKLKDYKGAIANINKFISLNPKIIDAIKARGLVKFKQKDYKNALADFNEFLRLKPEDFGAYFFRGQTLTQLNKYQEAVEDYNKILPTEQFNGVIGINLEINSQTKLPIVTQVKDNYSAQKQGIKVGDKILIVDGKSTKNMSLKQVVDLLRGKPGTKLSVSIARSGNNKLEFNLTRIQLATTDIDTKLAKVYYQRGLTRIKLQDNQGARKDFQIAANLYKKEGKKNEYQQALAKIKELQ